MSGRVECFWLEPTETGRESLRRFVSSANEKCPGRYGYHNASAEIGDIAFPIDAEKLTGYGRDDFPHDDPRWPRACEGCGRPFADADEWQHNVERLYRGAPNGKLYTVRDAPPGAMYDAHWYSEKGPDGIALIVCLPPDGGLDHWHVDGYAKGGGRWTRTGKVPKITARPSILTPRYHGFLTDGFLVET